MCVPRGWGLLPIHLLCFQPRTVCRAFGRQGQQSRHPLEHTLAMAGHCWTSQSLPNSDGRRDIFCPMDIQISDDRVVFEHILTDVEDFHSRRAKRFCSSSIIRISFCGKKRCYPAPAPAPAPAARYLPTPENKSTQLELALPDIPKSMFLQQRDLPPERHIIISPRGSISGTACGQCAITRAMQCNCSIARLGTLKKKHRRRKIR
jgi:hypothetical protein